MYRYVALLLLTLTASSAAAWNDCGHMIVAAVAYRELTPDTRTKVDELLRLNPHYAEWTANTTATNRAETAFLLASTWADFIKRQPDYINDGDVPSGREAARNVGYADRLQHRYWHFVNIGFSPDGTAIPATPQPNVTTQIGAFRKVLASPKAIKELKSYDLVWLLHLVADLHQPLHATSRYTKRLPQGDRGGNAVALCRSPCKDNLHGFWDGALGRCRKPHAARAIARNLPAAPTAAATIRSELEWQAESFELARSVVYRSPIGLGKGPVKLDDSYRDDARRVARERAALAGARLAKLLNTELR